MPEQTSAEYAERLVRELLLAMEARELDRAERMMASGATIIFPGRREYSSQREMAEAAHGRYQWVKKTIDHIDVLQRQDVFVVYVLGSLSGVNRHGIRFAEIRFVDRFEICDGLIQKQEVWNDLAESGVLERRAT